MITDQAYQVALTKINGIGSVQAKQLLEHFGTAENIFQAKKKDLSAINGIGEIKAKSIKEFTEFKAAEEEIIFCQKHHIELLFITDTNYPAKLLHCYDAPSLLYYRGNANLNSSKIISIIGTRNNTEYGKLLTELLVEELAPLNVLIVSGLAFGIDAIAHKAAVKNNLPTVGVLAHGLHTIYPVQHKNLAKEMLLNGGLLTEFTKDTKPDKHNFPRRNRIVAGIADATIVVETATKGGSMITAELAYNYNRDVFAAPGKITDIKSGGCLKLIHQNKASILLSTAQIIESMGWANKKQLPKKQKEIFIDLSDDETLIIQILQQKESTHIDELFSKSGLSSSCVAAATLGLEFKNVLVSLPGKLYKLL